MWLLSCFQLCRDCCELFLAVLWLFFGCFWLLLAAFGRVVAFTCLCGLLALMLLWGVWLLLRACLISPLPSPLLVPYVSTFALYLSNFGMYLVALLRHACATAHQPQQATHHNGDASGKGVTEGLDRGGCSRASFLPFVSPRNASDAEHCRGAPNERPSHSAGEIKLVIHLIPRCPNMSAVCLLRGAIVNRTKYFQ